MSEEESRPGKLVSASRTTLSQLMQPEHANLSGNVHGGWIMKLVDEAGALACMRHSKSRVVTVAVDQMTFKNPIRIGDMVTLRAEISYTGTTSMEVEVRVTSENPLSDTVTHTNTAYLVYVALDDQGRPSKVPAIIPENQHQEKRMKHGKARQEYRLKHARQVEQELDNS